MKFSWSHLHQSTIKLKNLFLHKSYLNYWKCSSTNSGNSLIFYSISLFCRCQIATVQKSFFGTGLPLIWLKPWALSAILLSTTGDYTVSSVTTNNFIATKTLIHGNPQSDLTFSCKATFGSLSVVSGSKIVTTSTANLNLLSEWRIFIYIDETLHWLKNYVLQAFGYS